MIDYRELLVQYMMKIIDCNSHSFISDISPFMKQFDIETITALGLLEGEAKYRLSQIDLK